MGFRALVADDAGFLREILKNILEDMGFAVFEATNGVEAVNQHAISQPDLIFMDVVLPEKNGLEAAKEILQVFPLAKIITMSTLESSDLPEDILKIGVRKHMHKPFTKEQVKQIVKELIND